MDNRPTPGNNELATKENLRQRPRKPVAAVRKAVATMAVQLFPEMAHNVFLPLMRSLEKSKSDGSLSSEEIRELVAGCGIGAVVLDRLFEVFQGILRRGMEKKKLHF